MAGDEYTIKVLLSGDYEYLCHMYGLSGASGNVSYKKYKHFFKDVTTVFGATSLAAS